MAATEFTFDPTVEAQRASAEESRLAGSMDQRLLRGYQDLFDEEARAQLAGAQDKKLANFARLNQSMMSPTRPGSAGITYGRDVARAGATRGALQRLFERDELAGRFAADAEQKRATNQFLKERQHARNLNQMAKIGLFNQIMGAGLTGGTMAAHGIQRAVPRNTGEVGPAPKTSVPLADSLGIALGGSGSNPLGITLGDMYRS